MQTNSTPRPQQRKKRRRAAQQAHVLMTQESPDSESPCRASLQGEYALPHHMQTCIDTHYPNVAALRFATSYADTLCHIVLRVLCHVMLQYALQQHA